MGPASGRQKAAAEKAAGMDRRGRRLIGKRHIPNAVFEIECREEETENEV